MTADAVPQATSESASRALPQERWTIEPRSRGAGARARELWNYRKLTLFFGLKALQKLYARTKLGWVWILIRPLFPLLVKTLVFGGVLAVSSDNVPYFLFLVTATTVWELFASAVMWGTRSLELNRGLMRQIYVPRLILPLSMMTPAFLTFVIHLGVLVVAALWYRVTDGNSHVTLGVTLLWSVAACLMAVALALAISLWTSVPALSARDVRFTLGYVLGFWIFLTPVMYPMTVVPERWRPWMMLNPMAPIVEAFKYGILGVGTVQPSQLGIAAGVIGVLLIGGVWFFARAEADAADRV